MWRVLLVAFVIFWKSDGLWAAEAFQPGCTLPEPLSELQKSHPIDAACSITGETDSAKTQAQNRLKNNFCASGKPVAVTYADFKALQKKADQMKSAGQLTFGSDRSLPEDRAPLKNMATTTKKQPVGEGMLVRYVAFLSNPRYSGKETVNCKSQANGNEWFDIHMDLERAPGEPACRSITAEFSPHLRPEVWEVAVLRLAAGKVPVRITGQLFFDASHRPCKDDGDKVTPKRIAIWEIHPVYDIEVCRQKTLAACSVSNDKHWVPLSEWVDTKPDEDDEEQ